MVKTKMEADLESGSRLSRDAQRPKAQAPSICEWAATPDLCCRCDALAAGPESDDGRGRGVASDGAEGVRAAGARSDTSGRR